MPKPRTAPAGSPQWLHALIERRNSNQRRCEELININKRNVTLTRDQADEFDTLIADTEAIDERTAEWQEQEDRETAAARARVELGIVEPPVGPGSGGWSVGDERGGVYRDPWKDPTSPSYFKDLRNARIGDWAASDRLHRNEAAYRESRSGDMTTVAGAGGTFSPPLWLVSEFVALARPGRVTADLCHREVLPPNVSSINLPKVATGAATGVQATQNSALSDTAMTTTSVSSGITTVGGVQIVSLQLLNQSGIPFDRVVLGDLAADYAKQLDNQVLYGSNASNQLDGLVNVATNNAYTTTSPALVSTTSADSFYNKTVKAAAGIATTRFMPAEAIVMHPNRWAWCLQALDGDVRPIIATGGSAVNAPAISTTSAAEGAVGELGRVPVYVDPNISQTANSTSGTTAQDEVYVLRGSDVYLYESDLRLESFDEPHADTASVLFRALGWAAFIPTRYSGAIQSIRGTGLLLPTL